ncbi:uncharacterized protein LOC123533973 [Mercenaria mercenaria]|uniref:uncharacterized protein LOC123533973 n=1 Tax=Mercenaria mercenaria TaxID=6596 RepID=UPI00234E4E50|nr:uncharacterized protein LOC123533973 [Mercenaria mercenaria]
MSSAQVHVLTFLSKTHLEKGRYAVSVEVTQKKKSESVKKKRKSEEQGYMELECVVGSCSPEFELPLKNKKCDIQFTVFGALKPQSELEKGEDIIEYNESLGECRRLLTLVPTYDEAADGNATIKFKVDGKVKHTVTIHDVPATRSLSTSTSSSSSSFVDVRGAERQTSVRSNASSSFRSNASSQSFSSMEQSLPGANDTINEGSAREHYASASGEGHWKDDNPEAVPMPPRSLDQRIGDIAIRDRGPDVVPANDPDPNETAYDKLLCNESLSTLSWALSPADANRLLIGLGVPNQVHAHNQKNHAGDVVSGNYESFRYWRSQKKSRRQQHEASNQQMYEDLILELDDIGRKDLKIVVKRALEENKKLEKNDFKHL